MNAIHQYLSKQLPASIRLLSYSIGKPLLLLGILLSWPWPQVGGGAFIAACVLFLLGLCWVNRYAVLASAAAVISAGLIASIWHYGCLTLSVLTIGLTVLAGVITSALVLLALLSAVKAANN